jgi:hypothetical protein
MAARDDVAVIVATDTPLERRARMKWYVLTLCLLVGFVWSASAEQMDPKLVGTWETYDGPCSPCTLTIQGSGQVSLTRAGSPIEVVFSRETPGPGLDILLPRGGKLDLSLSKSNALVGFYTIETHAERYVLVVYHRK